ncbi:hypothetical protein DFP73DRAFT_525356 [Morchella snyderi]|nr:hypothetical protein DFP73DRAFT_525356 [Morchella snyderi]
MDKASKLRLLHIQGCDYYFESRKLPATERRRMQLSDIFDLSFGAMYDVISQPPYSNLWENYTEQEQELIIKWEIQAKWQSWITQVEWETGDSQRRIEGSQCGEIIQMIELGMQEVLNFIGSQKASQWLEGWLDIFLYNTSLEDDVFLGSRTWSYLNSCGNASIAPGCANSLSGWQQQLNNFRFRHTLDIKLEDAITCFSYGADFLELRLHRFIQEGGPTNCTMNYIRRATFTISLCVDHQIDLLFRYNLDNNEVVPVMGIKDRQSVQRFLLQQVKDCRNPISREILSFWYNAKFVPYVKWNLICVGYLWAALTITTLLSPTKFILCFNEQGPARVLDQLKEVWQEIEVFLTGLDVLLQDIKIKKKSKKKGRKGGLKHLATCEPVVKENEEYNNEEIQVHSQTSTNPGEVIRKNTSGGFVNNVHKPADLEISNLFSSVRNALEVKTGEINKTMASLSADNSSEPKSTNADQKQKEDTEKKNSDSKNFTCKTGNVGPSHILTGISNKNKRPSNRPATVKAVDQLSIPLRLESITKEMIIKNEVPGAGKPDHNTKILLKTDGVCSGSGPIDAMLTETEQISTNAFKVDIYPISNTRKMGKISALSTTFGGSAKRKFDPTRTESQIAAERNGFDETENGDKCKPIDTLETEVFGPSKDNRLVINSKEYVPPLHSRPEEKDGVDDSFSTRWDELEKKPILKQEEERRGLGMEWPRKDAPIEQKQSLNSLAGRTHGKHKASATVGITTAMTDCCPRLVSPKSFISAKNSETEVYIKRTSAENPQERKQASTPTRYPKEEKQAPVAIDLQYKTESQKKISIMNTIPDISPLDAKSNGKGFFKLKGSKSFHTARTPEQNVDGLGNAPPPSGKNERALGKPLRRSAGTPIKRKELDTVLITSPSEPRKVLLLKKSEETDNDLEESPMGSGSTCMGQEEDLCIWERLSDFGDSCSTESGWKLVKKPDKRKAKANEESLKKAMPQENNKPSQNIKPSEKTKISEKPKPPENKKLSDYTKLLENTKLSMKTKSSITSKLSDTPEHSEVPKLSEKPKPSGNQTLSEEPKPSENLTLSEKPKSSENLKHSDGPKPLGNRLQTSKLFEMTQKLEEKNPNRPLRVGVKQEANGAILRNGILNQENTTDSVTEDSRGIKKSPLSGVQGSEKQAKMQETPPRQTNSQVLEKKDWASIISNYEAGGRLGAKETQAKEPKSSKGSKIFSNITKSTTCGEEKTETGPENDLLRCPPLIKSTMSIHVEPVQSKPIEAKVNSLNTTYVYPTPKDEDKRETGPEKNVWGWPPLVNKPIKLIPPEPAQITGTDGREVHPLDNTYAATLKSGGKGETGLEKNVSSWPPLFQHKDTDPKGAKPLDKFQRQLNTSGAEGVITKTQRMPSKEQQQESNHSMRLFGNRSKHGNTLRTSLKDNQDKTNIDTPTRQKTQQVQVQCTNISRNDQTLEERGYLQVRAGDKNNASEVQITVESLVERAFDPKNVLWVQNGLDLQLGNSKPKKEKREHISTKQKPHKSPTTGKVVRHEAMIEKLKREILEKEQESVSLRVQLALNEELIRKDKTIQILEQEISGRDAILSLCHARIRDLIQDRMGLVAEATALRCFIDILTHGTVADRARAMLDGHMSIQRPLLRSAYVNSLGQFIENRPVFRSPSRSNRSYTNTEHDIVAILDGINPKLDQQPLVDIDKAPANTLHMYPTTDQKNFNVSTLDLAPPNPTSLGQQAGSSTYEMQLLPPLLRVPAGGIQDPNFPYISVDTHPLRSGSGPKTFLPSAPLLPRRQVGGLAPREEKPRHHIPTQRRNVPSVRGPSPFRPISNIRLSPTIHRRNSLPLRNIRSSSNPVPKKLRSQNNQDHQRPMDRTSPNSLIQQNPQENNSLSPNNMHGNSNIIPPEDPPQNAQHHQIPGEGPSQNSPGPGPANQNLQENNSPPPNMLHNTNSLPSQNPQNYQEPVNGSSQNISVKESLHDKNTPRESLIIRTH